MSADTAVKKAAPTVGLAPTLAWASGSFATGALFNALALFGLFFMTSVLGIAPAVAGTLILIARVYDGIIDPLIGAVSDRTKHRWGPRRIYLLIGALGLGASFISFFSLGLLGVGGHGDPLFGGRKAGFMRVDGERAKEPARVAAHEKVLLRERAEGEGEFGDVAGEDLDLVPVQIPLSLHHACDAAQMGRNRLELLEVTARGEKVGQADRVWFGIQFADPDQRTASRPEYAPSSLSF